MPEFNYVFIFILLSLTSCSQVPYPPVSELISSEFLHRERIFPIAELDMSQKGIKEKLFIVYPYLDYKADSTQFFISGDNPSKFSFQVLKDGKLKPLFSSKALQIKDNETDLFIVSQKKYDSARKFVNPFEYIKFPHNPGWWQNDETPLDDNGKKLDFICQIEMLHFIKHDCIMFVFYDRSKLLIKNICQWD